MSFSIKTDTNVLLDLDFPNNRTTNPIPRIVLREMGDQIVAKIWGF